MSSGQSPSTVTRHPPGRRSHAASISVEQYQVALKLSSSRPVAPAHHVHPLPGDRAGRDGPGGDLDVPDRGGHLAGGLDRVERHPERVADEPERGAEGLAAVRPAHRVEGGRVLCRSP